jgi:hypothetical protein
MSPHRTGAGGDGGAGFEGEQEDSHTLVVNAPTYPMTPSFTVRTPFNIPSPSKAYMI